MYSEIDVTRAALSSVNMPPNNPAYSTPIKTFLCPSSPGPPTIVYSAELANSFNNFGIAVDACGRPDLRAEPTTLLTPAWRRTCRASASTPAPRSFASPRTARCASTDITDGTSNTMMVVEDAGRPGWYGSKGVASQPAIGGYTPAMGSYQGGVNGPAPQGGGAWADPLNYIATNGCRPERLRHRRRRRLHGHARGAVDLRATAAATTAKSSPSTPAGATSCSATGPCVSSRTDSP